MATFSSSPVATRPATETWVVERYIALGDSFTAGADPQAPSLPGLEAPSGENGDGSPALWPDRLAEHLRQVNPGLDYRNLAVAGARSQGVATGQLDAAVALGADLVTLICGANDVLLSVRPDIDAYAATFSAMLDRLSAELPEAAVVTATTPDFSEFLPLRARSRERVSRGMQELNEATRAIARRHGVLCLEWAGHPSAGDRSNYADDGIHASAVGHRRAAAALAQALADHFSIKVPPLPPEDLS